MPHLAQLAPQAVPERPADEWLVTSAKGGDAAALRELIDRYRPLAHARARSYFVAGGDREDVVQEGMIGLYKAIRDFDPLLGTSFRSFADVCVTRQILTAVKSSTRHKHTPLNGYLSLSRPAAGANDDPVAHLRAGVSGGDPADLVISAERVRALQRHVLAALSELETEVLWRHVDGQSYAEIAADLDRHVKTVDNALQRVKRKVESHLRARALAEAG